MIVQCLSTSPYISNSGQYSAFDELGIGSGTNNSVAIIPNYINFHERFIKPYSFDELNDVEQESRVDYDYNRNDSADLVCDFQHTGSIAKKYLLRAFLSSSLLLPLPTAAINAEYAKMVNSWSEITAHIYAGAITFENELMPDCFDFTWLEKVGEFDKSSMFDHAIDLVFKNINNMFLDGKFDDVDNLLKLVNVKQYSANVLLALLTITLCAKNKLPRRRMFYEKVKHQLVATEIYDDAILAGLD